MNHGSGEQNGAGDRQRINNVQGMVWGRDLWPCLMNDIYGAIPKPTNAAVLSGNLDEIKKTQRKSQDSPNGAIISREGPIHISNVKLVESRVVKPAKKGRGE